MSTNHRSLYAPARTARLAILLAVALTFIALAAAGSGLFLTASAAGPWYVATDGNDANDCLTTGTACLTIQAAIDLASPGDTINVAAGTYTEDLTITKQIDLVGAGSGTTTIKGVAKLDGGLFPQAAPNINIEANGVKIHGFTIESPAVGTTDYSSGIVLVGTNIEIFNNAFVVSAGTPGSVGIQTWHRATRPSGDISGLNIHDNTFTSLLPEDGFGYEAIFINPQGLDVDTANPVVIANNTFSGKLYRAIASVRSYTTIGGSSSGNVITTSLGSFPSSPFGAAPMGIAVGWEPLTNVSVLGNTINSTGGGAFENGIIIGAASVGMAANVSGNVVAGTAQNGIQVKGGVTGVTVNRNSLVGNATGVSNEFGSTEGNLDATCNWWGAADGPGPVGPGSGDPVSADVTFQPWLLSSTPLTAATCGGPATRYLVTAATNSPVAGDTVLISAQLADASGNAVPTAGLVVTWTKSATTGSFASPTSTTDSSGVATVVFTTHTASGTSTTVTATSPGPLTGTSATITTVASASPTQQTFNPDATTHLFCFFYHGPTTHTSDFGTLFAPGINAVSQLQFPSGTWLSWFRGFTVATPFSISEGDVLCVAGTGASGSNVFAE